MNIHKVFDLGSSLYRDFLENDGGNFSQLNPDLLDKYRRAFVFYKAYRESGYSFIAAYFAASFPTRFQYVDAELALIKAMGDKNSLCDFKEELNRQIYKSLLLNNADDSLRADEVPGLLHDTTLPYSFLIEVLTCKEVKGLALVLLAFGALSLVVAAGSVLGVAAAGTALNMVGATVSGATIAGNLSALLGTATLLFGSCRKNQSMSAQADYEATFGA